jgi:hypothetical protein
MTLSEKIWNSSIGAFIAYGKTAAAAALKPLLVTDNGDGTGTLVVSAASSALPTGAATSANQTALIAKIPDQSGGKVPVVMASETDIGTMQDDIALIKADIITIKGAISGSEAQVDVVSLPATPAGTAIIGKVGIDQTTPGTTNKVDAGYTVVRSDTLFTGMDATSQYDAVGALVEIPNWARVAGGSATIREMRISVNNNAIAPQFEVHFFRTNDATVAADNVTWTELAAEYAKRAGYVIMPACAKSTGSGTIDMVRSQADDYGQALSKEITCAAGATSIWVKLKLLTSGISFAGTPGNTIVLSMVREQS